MKSNRAALAVLIGVAAVGAASCGSTPSSDPGDTSQAAEDDGAEVSDTDASQDPDGQGPDVAVNDASSPLDSESDAAGAGGDTTPAADAAPGPDSVHADDADSYSSTDAGGDGQLGPDAQGDATSPGEPPIPCTSDLECGEEGMVCDPLPGVCVECLFDADCAADERCVERACSVAVPCQSSLDCVDIAELPICDVVATLCVECVESTDCDGSAECDDAVCVPFEPCSSSKDCTDMVCDKVAGKCVDCVDDADCDGGACVDSSCQESIACATDLTCTPLGMLCDKDAGVCEECITDADCPDVYHCLDNQCSLDVCVPGWGSCAEGVPVECAPSGSGLQELAPCPAETTCSAIDGVADCAPWLCTPGPPVCIDNTVIECAPSGLEIIAEQACLDGEETCIEGACVELVCDPAWSACSDDQTAVLSCATDGLSEITTHCPPASFCEDAACQSWVCEPDAMLCDGNKAVTCDAVGSGFLVGGQDCAILTCVDGACVQFVCDAGSVTGCADDFTLETCADSGTAFDSVACEPGEYCAWTDDGAACLTQVCIPDSPICAGNTATSCDPAGSGPVPGGEICGDGVCVDGVCVAPTCDVGTSWCEEGALLSCGADGFPEAPTPCASGSTCAPQNEVTALCVPWVCTPDEKGCWDGVAGTCAPDGLSVPDGDDCAAAGLVCQAGACVSPLLGTEQNPAQSCDDILTDQPESPDGLYWVQLTGPAFQTLCDMSTLGGGWTLLQRTVYDWELTAVLHTDYATWRTETLGTAEVGHGFRVAGMHWPHLAAGKDHLIRAETRGLATGTSCEPLFYEGVNGTFTVSESSTHLTGVQSSIELTPDTELSAVGSGPAAVCVSPPNLGVPWFYDFCCTVCPSFAGSYFETPHPMIKTIDVLPDAFGQVVADVCAESPFQEDDYYVQNSIEYYVR